MKQLLSDDTVLVTREIQDGYKVYVIQQPGNKIIIPYGHGARDFSKEFRRMVKEKPDDWQGWLRVYL